MPDQTQRPVLTTGIYYQDPLAALDWLEKAFGFERVMVITDQDGKLAHSEMRFGDGLIYVGSPWSEAIASPRSIGGKCTQTVHIQLKGGIDGHCARAREAGAEIMQEPEDQFYGDRTYRARDPEGHVWTFGQTVRAVTREEAEKVSGLKIEGWV
ncbi:MAG: VOC family protein [Alphaproteobacteria bacterium]|nr:VOC family protein [Alphaproteobacteria bacterium]MBU6473814.1 VOC family protein [Alphaproteobacteria bacterium]MDE2013149.1 VOC family protein [Alphaproteobacteria bacterium]MDE2072766.1 VOC family protein [Alphaproteobacteria bacterium]MDE2352140.1 VOC family protein [Alphaproteobacteria bacterium]